MENSAQRVGWTRNLKNNIFILKVLGIWPFETKYRCLNDVLFKIHRTIIFAFVTTCIMLQTIQLAFINDLYHFIGSTFIVLQPYHVLAKMYYFVKNLDTLKKLLHFLENEEIFQPKTQKQQNLILTGLLWWKRSYIAFFVSASTTLSFWTLFPILDNLTENHELPFHFWFPFDVNASPSYEIAYGVQVLYLWQNGLLCIGVDTFITALVTFIGLQCDLLCDNLKNAGCSQQNKATEDFLKCIHHHKKILKLSDDCIKFISGMVFVQIFTTATIIGLAMCQLSLISIFSSEFYSILSYISSVIYQVFMYCWCGNELIYKSSRIADFAFETKLMDAPLFVKKNLIFFIARVQKPIRIPVFHITSLSVNTFVKILRVAWSYFALFHQVIE